MLFGFQLFFEFSHVDLSALAYYTIQLSFTTRFLEAAAMFRSRLDRVFAKTEMDLHLLYTDKSGSLVATLNIYRKISGKPKSTGRSN